jgi:hypothetical protein
MTRFAVWVALVHCETNVIVEIEFAITCDRQSATPRRRRQEGIATLSTKKVLLVVSPLSQCLVVKRDEPFVNNRRFAVIATRREVLVVIKMTIRFSFVFEARDMFKKLVTRRTTETPWVPALSHCTDDTSNNWTTTSGA